MRTYSIASLWDWPAPFGSTAGSGNGSFFELLDWYKLIAQSAAGPEVQANLVVESSGRVAMACLVNQRRREVRSCTNLYTCRFDVLGARHDTEAIKALVRELVSSRWPIRRLQVEGFDASTALLGTMVAALWTEGLVAKPYFGWANWFEPTAGMSFEEYVARRPSILRHTWRRKRAALDRKHKIDFAIHRDVNDSCVFIYNRIGKESWKAPEPFPNFIPRLMQVATSLGAARLGILSIDGDPVAVQFWIVWNGQATIFKLVHAERVSDLSPGTILTMEMIRTILEQDRPHEIDFGRGDDAYKKLWVSSRRECWGIEAANPWSVGGSIHAARIGLALGRDAIKRYSYRDDPE